MIDLAVPQKGQPEYFPKRIPEDGFIDWNMSAKDIYNQIRALSDPYPNARTVINDKTIFIKKASFIDQDYQVDSGEILFCFPTGQILVATGDGTLVIEESASFSSSDTLNLHEGECFTSVPMKKTVRRIINRFKVDFPDKKINNSLVEFLA